MLKRGFRLNMYLVYFVIKAKGFGDELQIGMPATAISVWFIDAVRRHHWHMVWNPTQID